MILTNNFCYLAVLWFPASGLASTAVFPCDKTAITEWQSLLPVFFWSAMVLSEPECTCHSMTLVHPERLSWLPPHGVVVAKLTNALLSWGFHENGFIWQLKIDIFVFLNEPKNTAAYYTAFFFFLFCLCIFNSCCFRAEVLHKWTTHQKVRKTQQKAKRLN